MVSTQVNERFATKDGGSHGNGAEEQESECSASGMMSQCVEEARHVVENYPASSMLVTMGVGIGVGLLLGMTMFGPPKSRQEEAEDFLMRFRDRFADMLPKSLARHVHS